MLFKLELKKIMLLPVIIVFAALSIVLNAVIVVTSNDYTLKYEGEIINIFEGFNTSQIAETYIMKYGITGKNADNIRNKYEKLQPVIDKKPLTVMPCQIILEGGLIICMVCCLILCL